MYAVISKPGFDLRTVHRMESQFETRGGQGGLVCQNGENTRGSVRERQKPCRLFWKNILKEGSVVQTAVSGSLGVGVSGSGY